MKQCRKCHTNLPSTLEFFYRDSAVKCGLRSRCKSCDDQNKPKYRKQNAAVRREYEKRYYKTRRVNDPSFKLKKDLSTIIRRIIKKSNSTWSILPYSPQQLKEHLEQQFDFNMTWENHGKYWHIDHIHPQSKLPYDSLEHPNFLKCWELNNLRPLEKFENLRKGNK